MKIPGSRESSAYNLALFEEREERKRQEDPDIQMKKNPNPIARKGNVFKILAVAFVVSSFLLSIIYHKAELSELSKNISNANLALEEALSEGQRLQVELDNIVTLARVEDFAQNELGMQKILSNQGTHISIDTGGVTEIAPSDNFMPKWFSDIVEFFRAS